MKLAFTMLRRAALRLTDFPSPLSLVRSLDIDRGD
jgi:hypothetical protein